MKADRLFEPGFEYTIHPKDHQELVAYFLKKQGWVYIARSLQTPMLKIGRTSKQPLERAKTLSTAGVAYDYEIVFSLQYFNQFLAEKNIHNALKAWRGPKEFFNISLEAAIHALEQELDLQRRALNRFFDVDAVSQDIHLLPFYVRNKP